MISSNLRRCVHKLVVSVNISISNTANVVTLSIEALTSTVHVERGAFPTTVNWMLSSTLFRWPRSFCSLWAGRAVHVLLMYCFQNPLPACFQLSLLLPVCATFCFLFVYFSKSTPFACIMLLMKTVV